MIIEKITKKYQTGKHLEAFILLTLVQQPMHGGSILKNLGAWLPDHWNIDSGNVYRLLRDLEKSGCLTSQWTVEDSGAPIRTYTLTNEGKARLQTWKEDIQIRQSAFDTFLDLYRQSVDS